MNRIGLFGGTFDPIHYGHLNLASEIKKQLDLDEILFIPNNKNPFKQKQQNLQRKHCYNMVKEAIKEFPDFKVTDLEIQREGTSFTIDTVNTLLDSYPAKYYFIIGADILESLENWKDIEELLNKVTFVVADRPKNHHHQNIEQQIEYLNKKFKTNILHIKIKESDVSSTVIRDRVKDKKSINSLTPEKVVQYIEKYHLYEN